MEAILFDNGIEIKRARYPRKDMGVVSGLRAGLEWKLIITTPPVAYDSRIYTAVKVEENTNEYHDTHTHLKVYKVSYDIQPKSDAAIIAAINRAERNANESIVDEQERFKILTLGLGILIRKANGINISAKEVAILDRILAKAVSIWQNDSILKAKIQNIIDGIPEDIDSGWVDSE